MSRGTEGSIANHFGGLAEREAAARSTGTVTKREAPPPPSYVPPEKCDRFMLDEEELADINKKYPKAGGKTALMRCVCAGEKDDVIEALEAKADVTITDDLGRTPFMEAARRGLYDIAKLLLEKNKTPAHVDAQDNESRTALHFAAEAYLEDKSGDIKYEIMIQVVTSSGALGLEDGLNRLPDAGKEADFRTSKSIDDAIKRGEGARKEQRRLRQERAAAAYSNAHAEFQKSATASMAGVA